MKTANDLIELALAQVGYCEKASNDQLDDMTANAGSANFTKYARDIGNTDIYGYSVQGLAWCDTFVDWCFMTCFGTETAKKLLCQPSNSSGAACEYSAQYFKNAGQFDVDPIVGAQIFFYSGGGINHTGIVYDFDTEYVWTVEGNSGDKVARRTYKRKNASIAGYGIPNFENPSEPEVKPESDALCKRGSTGYIVGSVQALLKQHGFTPSSSVMYNGLMDEEYGVGTENAVKLFQSSHNLPCTGEVDETTLEVLVKGGD